MGMFSFQQMIQKNYVRVLFPLTVLLLFFSTIYIFTVEPLPRGPDLCELWKERIMLKDKNDYKNISKQWWEWACLIEKEWDKGTEYSCRDERAVGNYKICFDVPFKPQAPCLVYSFGIDNDFRFDDAMGKEGCDVYSFDPSMEVESHNRSNKVHFINMGLATSDSDDFLPLIDGYTVLSKRRWKIRTLSSIRKMLNHQDRPIDVLKIDIETYEWAVVKQMLEDGLMKSVRQLTLEWHIFPNEPMRTEFHNMFISIMQLKELGFRQFYSNPYSRYHTMKFFNSQCDSSYVNVLFGKQDA